jgi:hypothetical protein
MTLIGLTLSHVCTCPKPVTRFLLKLSSHNNSKIKNSSSLMKSISENFLLEKEFFFINKIKLQPIVH